MVEEELEVVRLATKSIAILLKGEVPARLCPSQTASEDIRLLCETLNKLIEAFDESRRFITCLGQGNLDVDPPSGNSVCSPYKQLHSNLRHLVWQTQQVAKGDLSQQVDFLGTFADAFNGLIRSLREKRSLEAALQESHAKLEARVKERTAELTATNEQLRREIVERTEAEKRLEQALRDLTRINNELRQFAFASSHDLKEPLHNLTLCVQMLQRHLNVSPGSYEEKCISWAVDSAGKLATLIDDVLAFSRLEEDRNFGPADAEAAFKRAISQLTTAIDEAGATVTHEQLPVVKADSAQLAQLFKIIISNAVKFRSNEPLRVHISAKSGNEEHQFSIRDNGIGIEQEYLDGIFSMFKRLHGKHVYAGSGMGLAIAKKIVEGHGGRIWAESAHGKGATFHFVMPAG